MTPSLSLRSTAGCNTHIFLINFSTLNLVMEHLVPLVLIVLLLSAGGGGGGVIEAMTMIGAMAETKRRMMAEWTREMEEAKDWRAISSCGMCSARLNIRFLFEGGSLKENRTVWNVMESVDDDRIPFLFSFLFFKNKKIKRCAHLTGWLLYGQLGMPQASRARARAYRFICICIRSFYTSQICALPFWQLLLCRFPPNPCLNTSEKKRKEKKLKKKRFRYFIIQKLFFFFLLLPPTIITGREHTAHAYCLALALMYRRPFTKDQRDEEKGVKKSLQDLLLLLVFLLVLLYLPFFESILALSNFAPVRNKQFTARHPSYFQAFLLLLPLSYLHLIRIIITIIWSMHPSLSIECRMSIQVPVWRVYSTSLINQ